jgi:triosephosphate isomerase
VVIAPNFLCLPILSKKLGDHDSVSLAAQNVSQFNNGAFTGETSVMMLKELYLRYVIIGHSERRSLFGDTDEVINAKLSKALEANLRPIFCIGETLEERKAGELEKVLRRQITRGLAAVTEKDMGLVTIAYEPVWAIGTGETASALEAQAAHQFVRSVVAELYSEEIGAKVRIQYGGSVKPANAAELMAQPDIDGALVGGASLEAQSFYQIVMAAADCIEN